MAVISVGELWERRRSSFRDGTLTHYLEYQVVSDSPEDGPQVAIGASGIPQLGDVFIDAYSQVAYYQGTDVDPRNGADSIFDVLVTFVFTPAAPDDNPLHQPATYAWSYAEQEETYFADCTPNTATPPGPLNVVNSAGDVFEQMPKRYSGRLQITVTRNEATNDAANNDQYSNTVNQVDTVLDGTTYTAGTLLLRPITAHKAQKTLKTNAVITYYAKTYTFLAKHEGWDDKPLDVGYNEQTGVKGTNNPLTTKPIVDSLGMPIKKPWPLNGSGVKMPNITDTPATLDFKPYITMDWTPLQFGGSGDDLVVM